MKEKKKGKKRIPMLNQQSVYLLSDADNLRMFHIKSRKRRMLQDLSFWTRALTLTSARQNRVRQATVAVGLGDNLTAGTATSRWIYVICPSGAGAHRKHLVLSGRGNAHPKMIPTES